MQIKCLHRNMYRLYTYARTQECLSSYKNKHQIIVNKWEKLKSENVSDKVCQEFSGVSRATYYRAKAKLADLAKNMVPPSKRPKKVNKPRWGEAQMQLVLQIRRHNPTYGKAKIAVILKRDHEQTISESTVGRIIKALMNKGLITRSASSLRVKRKREFRNHAKAWEYGMKGNQPGEMVQVDHMTVTKNQLHTKHFQAWDPKSKFIFANVYSKASSLTAKKFLLELQRQAPFKIKSIQVDGGSEFMRDFEESCQDLGIELYVLPPRRPQYNGGVERGNRIFREEFYEKSNLLADSIGAMRYELSKALDKYNTYRPHFNLKGLTPMQYIGNQLSETTTQSHII